MSIRFRRAWRIAGVVGVASLTVPMSPAGAESLRYQAGAAADGARLSVTIPGATVVDQVIDGGGPTAQAAVSSLGGSSALAAQPYPGELAIIGPGLGASLIGAPQPPAYPFVAASRYPSAPEQSVEPNPGYSLVARSTESTSEASARSGAANEASKVLLTQATATVKADPGQVVAEASNQVEALTVGPLSIASAASSARVVGKPNGDPERQSSLAVNGITITGQAVGFTDAGFVTPGGATPLPSSDPLLKALSSAGVAVSYLKSETTPTGVVAPGLQIVTTQAVPGVGRTATISLTLGRASANAQASTEAVELPADVPIAASPESAPDGSLIGSDVPTPVAIAPSDRVHAGVRPHARPPILLFLRGVAGERRGGPRPGGHRDGRGRGRLGDHQCCCARGTGRSSGVTEPDLGRIDVLSAAPRRRGARPGRFPDRPHRGGDEMKDLVHWVRNQSDRVAVVGLHRARRHLPHRRLGRRQCHRLSWRADALRRLRWPGRHLPPRPGRRPVAVR